jgi:hypothetical protein
MEDGTIPKDFWYYADKGMSIGSTVIFAVVLAPIWVLVAIAAAFGWAVEKHTKRI